MRHGLGGNFVRKHAFGFPDKNRPMPLGKSECQGFPHGSSSGKVL